LDSLTAVTITSIALVALKNTTLLAAAAAAAVLILKLFPVIITVSPASPVNGENKEITGSVTCTCVETTNEKKIILTQIDLLKEVVNKINLI
jgi:hypothetical protein